MEARVAVSTNADILQAREKAREVAQLAGFTTSDLTFVATAISSLARNILTFARSGDIVIRHVSQGVRHGIEVVASDSGPGMPAAYTTAEGLPSGALGLRGLRQFMDDVEIDSKPGEGTRVTARKWLR